MFIKKIKIFIIIIIVFFLISYNLIPQENKKSQTKVKIYKFNRNLPLNYLSAYKLAQIYLEQGDITKSIENIDYVIKKSKNKNVKQEAKFLKLKVMYHYQDKNDTLNLMYSLLNEDFRENRMIQIKQMYCYQLIRLKNYEKAESELHRFLAEAANDKERANYYFHLTDLYIRTNDYERAKSILEKEKNLSYQTNSSQKKRRTNFLNRIKKFFQSKEKKNKKK